MKLDQALEQAYDAFAGEPRPKRLRCSPARDQASILRSLSAAPLRGLSAEQIGPYAGWALTTVGDEQAYRHFLPRILQLAVEDLNWLGAEPAVIASKLRVGGWRNWTTQQQRAVELIFQSAFEWSLTASSDAAADTGRWLCGLALIGLDLVGALDLWRTSEHSMSAYRLAQFVGEWNAALERCETAPPFWTDVDPEKQRVVCAWVYTPLTIAKLHRARNTLSADERWDVDEALEKMPARH